MNFTIAAVAAGAAFLLSFLMGLIGGVPFADIVVRALLWAAVGFGGALGVEALLRAVLPDLLEARAPAEVSDEAAPEAREPERTVDIIVEDDEPPVRTEIPAGGEPRSPAARPAPETPDEPAAEAVPVPPAPGEEEMPEIGSFLDAFKPGGPEAPDEPGAPASPEINEYAPSQWAASSGGDSKAPAEAQEDPAILAKAVQTVMKRDGQGT